MKQLENFIWSESYRPHRVEDCILPEQTKQMFESFVEKKQIPNLLLSGPSGTGKTTVARALLEELDCDYIVINGSLNGNIDTLRNEIQQFASSVSFSGGKKYVILDEADYLTSQFQPALRNFIESFSANCGFILTCNYKNRILPAIQSRLCSVDFKVPTSEKTKIAAQFFKRVIHILDSEEITYDKKFVADVVNRFFPDFRKTTNELQRLASLGAIDGSNIVNTQETATKELIKALRDKNFNAMRKWVGENSDMDTSTLFRDLYDNAQHNCDPQSIPQLVLHLATYQYQAAFVADSEINIVSCLTEIMRDVDFK